MRWAKLHKRFSWKNEDYLGDLGIDGKIILNCLQETMCEAMYWIPLDQERISDEINGKRK
jgi:hypothetical protein